MTERMSDVRSVALGVWVGVGARDEPAELAGASHFLEHLLFKGTPTRSARQIAEAIEAVGGDMNAHTGRESTAYYARLPADHIDLGLDILGDVLTKPAFRPPEVDSERQVILEELLMHLDMPDSLVHTQMAEALFPGHPLGREVAGTKETVEVIARDEIAAFFERWYKAENLAVVAAGLLDHDRVVEAFEASLGGLDAGAAPERQPPSAPPEPLAVQGTDIEQVHVELGWRALDHFDPDRYALSVLNQVIGGGMASRLFQQVREERGLCYTVYSWASTAQDSGAAGIYAATNPKRLRELLAVLDDEVAKLLAGGITEAELQLAQGCLDGSMVLGLESSESRMERLGWALSHRGEVLSLDEELARIHAVTVDDCARVAERVFGGPRTLSVIGPVSKGDIG
ncbi:MAG TPA: pitrilysin family protein [Acidimicrobiales bacterium]